MTPTICAFHFGFSLVESEHLDLFITVDVAARCWNAKPTRAEQITLPVNPLAINRLINNDITRIVEAETEKKCGILMCHKGGAFRSVAWFNKPCYVQDFDEQGWHQALGK